MANQSPIPLIPLLKVPANYPTVPSPGKIRILYDKNKKELYHRLSPYGTDTFMVIKSTQPSLFKSAKSLPMENLLL